MTTRWRVVLSDGTEWCRWVDGQLDGPADEAEAGQRAEDFTAAHPGYEARAEETDEPEPGTFQEEFADYLPPARPYHVSLGFTDDEVARGDDYGRYDFPNLRRDR